MRLIWKIQIFESVRGRGEKPVEDMVFWFSDETMATSFFRDFNNRNTEAKGASFYRAELPAGVEIPDETEIIHTYKSMEEKLPPLVKTVLVSNAKIDHESKKRGW